MLCSWLTGSSPRPGSTRARIKAEVDAAEAAIEVKEEEFRAKVLKEKAEKRAERTRLKEERAIKQRGAIRLNRDTKALRAMQAQAKVQRAKLARAARMTAWLDALEAESQAWITEDKVRCVVPRQAGSAARVPTDALLASHPIITLARSTP